MIKKYIHKEKGLTLIEVLAVVVISMLILGGVYGAITSTLNFNNKTQSHIDLRQEANIIITQMRTNHQEAFNHGTEERYEICYENFVNDSRLQFQGFEVSELSGAENENEITFNEAGCYGKVNARNDLKVNFILADTENDEAHFEVDTIIESYWGLARTNTSNEENDPEDETPSAFYEYLKFNNVFVYGQQFQYSGNNLNGIEATMVVLGDLAGSQVNGGAYGNVSNIYIAGKGELISGQQFGSKDKPGNIYFDSDLTLGSYQTLYGNVYVNGNLKNIGSTINGNIYVNGDLEVGWTPKFNGDAKIYYTGTLTYPPDGYPQEILDRLVHQPTVPQYSTIVEAVPNVKSKEWFQNNGYSTEIKPDNMKIYGNNINIHSYYDSKLGRYIDTFTNAVIVSEGDISVRSGSLKMTGVLFAPNGKVTFEGTSFEGLVISKDGFFVISGGTTVNFKGIDHFIKNADDFPLQ